MFEIEIPKVVNDYKEPDRDTTALIPERFRRLDEIVDAEEIATGVGDYGKSTSLAKYTGLDLEDLDEEDDL